MANGNDSSKRETSEMSSTSERQETLEIDDETDTPRRLNRPVAVSPESGIVLDTGGTDVTTQNENTVVSESGEATGGLETDRYVTPNEMFSVDLTDPDEVMRLLETVDLTDEDTEVLLSEAYNVNRKLKEMLRKQESQGDIDPQTVLSNGEAVIVVPGKSFSSGQRGSSGNRPGGSGFQRQARGNSSRSRGDHGDLFTKNAPLPPIKDNLCPGQPSTSQKQIAIYSAKLRRPPPSSAGLTRNTQGSASHKHISRQGLMRTKDSQTEDPMKEERKNLSPYMRDPNGMTDSHRSNSAPSSVSDH